MRPRIWVSLEAPCVSGFIAVSQVLRAIVQHNKRGHHTVEFTWASHKMPATVRPVLMIDAAPSSAREAHGLQYHLLEQS